MMVADVGVRYSLPVEVVYAGGGEDDGRWYIGFQDDVSCQVAPDGILPSLDRYSRGRCQL